MSPRDLLARLEGWADAKLLELRNYDTSLAFEQGRDSAWEELLGYITTLKGEL